MYIPDHTEVVMRTMPQHLHSVLKDIVYKLQTCDELPVLHAVDMRSSAKVSQILQSRGYYVKSIGHNPATLTDTLEIN